MNPSGPHRRWHAVRFLRLAAVGFGVALAGGLGLVGTAAHAEQNNPADNVGGPRYTIQQVLVQGAAVFPRETIRALSAPIVGRPITEADIAHVAATMTDYYRRGGYFLARTDVPQQRLDYGMLVLRVAEGTVADVRVDGEPALYTAPLRQAIERLLTVRPMTEPAFKQAMQAFVAVPGLRTTFAFVPSSRGAGQYELVLRLSPADAPVVPASLGGTDAAAAVAASETGSVVIGELAPDLLEPRLARPDTAAPVHGAGRVSPSIGPFYVPQADGREDAYALLEYGPGWYKRSEEQGVLPAALGLRLRDDQTKVGVEAGLPFDNRVDTVHSRNAGDDIQVMFTVDRRF